MGDGSAPARRRTPNRVHLIDQIANSVIRLGGLAVIAAVIGIFVYLASVVVPLFAPGTAEQAASGQTKIQTDERAAVSVHLDEYGGSAAIVDSSGAVRAIELATGAALGELPAEPGVSAVSTTAGGLLAWGYEDGSFQLGVLSSSATVLTATTARSMSDARIVPSDGPFAGLRSLADIGTERVTTFQVEKRDLQSPRGEPGGVQLLDYRQAGGGREVLFTSWEDGSASLNTVRVVRPLGGGTPSLRLTGRAVSLDPASLNASWAVAFGDGDSVALVESSGSARRYGVIPGAERSDPLRGVEVVDLTGGSDATGVAVLQAARSFAVGDVNGNVWVWTLARDPQVAGGDGRRLVLADKFEISDAPVRSMSVGQSDRSLAVATADGQLRIVHLTSAKRVVSLKIESDVAVVGMSPRQDGLLALERDGQYAFWQVDPGYPGAGWRALFGRVLYEGETEPSFVYQSTSAEDGAEVKNSLVPLIYGTLKATVVAMLLAAPLAVLAAIYSSEFLHRSVRATLKPAIELMASLPSVVLGFIAMAIVSPWITDALPGVLLGFVVVPSGVLLGAHLWQLLPMRVQVRVPSSVHIGLIAGVILTSGWVSLRLGERMEAAFFGPSESDLRLTAGSYEALPEEQWPAWVGSRRTMAPDLERKLRTEGLAFRSGGVVRAVEPEAGSELAAQVDELRANHKVSGQLRSWLDGLYGRPWPGWFVLLMPLGGLLAWWCRSLLREFTRNDSSSAFLAGLSELGLFIASLAFAVIFAAGAGWALEAMNLDPRDSIFGPFSQRNTLVVGVVMGFAIIPIVYTISEDALSAVPQTLRSASLGAGATKWQTAWRVVLPVAGSGIFSACMIGLGRAAGETMIMLMATGNTPQMDANIFSGFRTLAANIATELPEAERGGTHYRVLFLCGLVLFAVTFVINTSAEVVRQRFRKKSATL